jgi:hypothetical protein
MRNCESCINCGEVREIAAHGLCFRCYRQRERAEDQKFAALDRHVPAIRREQKKIFRGFTNMMVGLADLGVQSADVLEIRRIIDPYIAPIAQFLAQGRHSKERPQ